MFFAYFILALSLMKVCESKNLLDSVREYKIVHMDTEHFERHRLTNEHAQRTEFKFSAYGHDLHLRLDKNLKLLGENYHEVRQSWRDGQLVSKRTHRVLTDAQKCWYQGTVVGQNGASQVAVSTCAGALRGSVQAYGQHFLLEPAQNHFTSEALIPHLDAVTEELRKVNHPALKTRPPTLETLHMVYLAHNVDDPVGGCGVTEDEETLARNSQAENNAPDAINHLLAKHGSSARVAVPSLHLHEGHDHSHAHLKAGVPEDSMPSQESGSPEPKTAGQKYIELIVVNDFRRFSEPSFREAPEDDSVDIINLVNGYYVNQNFNPPIRVTLVNQITFDTADPWETTVKLGCTTLNTGLGTCADATATETCVGDLLNAFNTWRGNTNNIGPHDDAQLFSSRDFSGYALGYASVSALCVYSRSSGINMTPPSQSQAFSSSVVAHELGHNLGSCAMPRTARLMLTNLIRSSHDNSANTCPVSGYIMNSQVSSSVVPTTFSPCSLVYIQTYVGANSVSCADNIPTVQWGDPVCGNGWLEGDEQCDCGSDDCDTASPPDSCCDGYTCTFKAGALCSNGDACCQNCVPLANGTLCRDRAGDVDCDIAEYCDGVSGACPSDGVQGPGLDCDVGYGAGMCYLGFCYTAWRQCYESGLMLSGGPYNDCPYDSFCRLNGWDSGDEVDFCGAGASMEDYACNTLWCQNDPLSCTYYRISGQVAYTDDGTPCSLLGGKQCLNNLCVPSSELNPLYQWSGSAWSECDQCDQMQTRVTYCESVEEVGVAVRPELCSAGGGTETSQLCQNATLACDHMNELTAGVIDFFGLVQLKTQTLTLYLLGGVSGLLIVLALCFNCITQEDEIDEDDK